MVRLVANSPDMKTGTNLAEIAHMTTAEVGHWQLEGINRSSGIRNNEHSQAFVLCIVYSDLIMHRYLFNPGDLSIFMFPDHRICRSCIFPARKCPNLLHSKKVVQQLGDKSNIFK